jgi:hypothetical protein
MRLLSNNGVGFAVWDKPAIGGQSGSGVWNHATNFQQLLLTWRTGNNNGAGQPLDYIWSQGQAAMETGVLSGGAMPDGLTPLSEVNEDCEEGFFCETSIRSLPIWAEDQQPTDPELEPGLPVSLAQLVESYRKIESEAKSMLARLEGASDVPRDPPSGPTFGL